MKPASATARTERRIIDSTSVHLMYQNQHLVTSSSCRMEQKQHLHRSYREPIRTSKHLLSRQHRPRLLCHYQSTNSPRSRRAAITQLPISRIHLIQPLRKQLLIRFAARE
jgi:hypothetical protein